MKAKLKDLLHAINIIGDDMDVCVDGVGEICVCPPIKLTAAGREYFKSALNAKVDCCIVCDKDDARSEEAMKLLESLAGYCSTTDFERWFEGDDAKLI